MGQLHELLAVEQTKKSATGKLIGETQRKFNKIDYFQGHVKTLKMIEDSPQNSALEQASAEVRELPTTVVETLEYMFEFWTEFEDVMYQKAISNQNARADLMFNGDILVANVPVDELLGLETRLTALRHLLDNMPTLNAASNWALDTQSSKAGTWKTVSPEVTTKTEKTTVPVVLYEATDKHPAQVKEVSSDKTVGTYTMQRVSGSATSLQKAQIIENIDKLIAEAKKARMRANTTEAATDRIGKILTDVIMSPFNV